MIRHAVAEADHRGTELSLNLGTCRNCGAFWGPLEPVADDTVAKFGPWPGGGNPPPVENAPSPSPDAERPLSSRVLGALWWLALAPVALYLCARYLPHNPSSPWVPVGFKLLAMVAAALPAASPNPPLLAAPSPTRYIVRVAASVIMFLWISALAVGLLMAQ